ncbi:MAG: hypothetical protein ACRYFS_24160 [Janthinobacterium lividum]
MRLIPISGQAGSNFAKTFRRMADESQVTKRCNMIADLIEHLEGNVVGPDTYAFKSMDELVLTDEDTWKKRLVTINADVNKWLVPDGYEIAYRVAPPWFHTIGYADTIANAAELVLEALHHADRNGKINECYI